MDAHTLRVIVPGVVGSCEYIKIHVGRYAIAHAEIGVVVWCHATRRWVHEPSNEGGSGRHRIDRRRVLLQVLHPPAELDLVLEAWFVGIPGNRYGCQIVLLRAEVSSLAKGEEIQVLVIVHGADVDANGQSLHSLPI